MGPTGRRRAIGSCPVPAAERRRPVRRRPRRLRCESCLEVLTLAHAWEVVTCSCGALTLSGRPARPAVHWLSRPGGGWTDLDTGADAAAGPVDPTGDDESDGPVRTLGFSPSAW